MALSPNFAGTWDIDPSHSQLGFMVRHAMVTKTRGQFTDYAGSFTIDPENVNNAANVVIQATSIDTGNADRDGHVRTGDFFEVEKYPEITFVATDAKVTGDNEGVLTGDLTIKGNTRPVELALEFNGSTTDPYGLKRAGFHAETEISRKEFGVDIHMPMESGGVVVGDKIKIEIDAEFTLQQG